MNLSSIKIANLQYRGGNTFRFRQRIIDRNGKTVDFTKNIIVPSDCKTIKEAKKFLEDKRAEFLTEKSSYYNQSERLFSDIIDEYFEQVGASLSGAVKDKNEYETGKRTVSIKTYETYQDYSPRVKAVLGSIKLKDISPIHIDNFKNILTQCGVRNDGLFFANEKLLNLFNTAKMSNNLLSKEIPINRHSLVNLRSGKGVSLKTANNVSNYFQEKFDDLFIEEVSDKGLAAKTINNYTAFISSVFEWAKRARYIKESPCDLVQKFKVNQDERKSLETDDIKLFLDALKNKNDIEFELQNNILVYCGCRRCEMLGLRFECYNSKMQTLTFKESVLYEEKVGCYLSTLKNSRIRTIKISNNLCQLIEKHKTDKMQISKQLGIEFDENQLMFTNTTGGYLHPDTFGGKLRRFKKSIGLENTEIKPLKLRHNYATQLLESGESPYAVAKDMGHFSPTTTFNYYADAIEVGKQKNLSQVLENIYK